MTRLLLLALVTASCATIHEGPRGERVELTERGEMVCAEYGRRNTTHAVVTCRVWNRGERTAHLRIEAEYDERDRSRTVSVQPKERTSFEIRIPYDGPCTQLATFDDEVEVTAEFGGRTHSVTRSVHAEAEVPLEGKADCRLVEFLPRSDVEQVLFDARPALVVCLERHAPQGRIEYDLVVRPTGLVQDVVLTVAGQPDEELEACFEEAAESWRFQPVDGKTRRLRQVIE